MQVSEKDFEDWVCANVAVVTGHDEERLVARQFSFPDGTRLDVLSGHPRGTTLVLTVIELKADRAGSAALLQLMDYMGKLRGFLHRLRPYLAHHGYEQTQVEVRGLLAAPEVCDSIGWALGSTGVLAYRQLKVQVTSGKIVGGVVWRTGEDDLGQRNLGFGHLLAGRIGEALQCYREEQEQQPTK